MTPFAFPPFAFANFAVKDFSPRRREGRKEKSKSGSRIQGGGVMKKSKSGPVRVNRCAGNEDVGAAG
jgi:hypothetical protein